MGTRQGKDGEGQWESPSGSAEAALHLLLVGGSR